jgi:alpha-ketoglutarate-dependent taurine dioxygenase
MIYLRTDNKSHTMVAFFKQVQYKSTPGFADELRQMLPLFRVLHLTGTPPQKDLRSFYTELTDRLGEIVPADEDNRTGDRAADRWTDIRHELASATANDGSFRHSSTQQPLHTDTAYTSYDNDVNFFFCEVMADVGGATTFIDGDALVSIMERYEPELLAELLKREVSFEKGTTERKVKHVIERREDGVWLNWNYFRISRTANNSDTITMCERFHRFLEEKIVKGGLLTGVILAPGEAVFFQDNRILHGRNAFYGDRVLIKGALNFRSEKVTTDA